MKVRLLALCTTLILAVPAPAQQPRQPTGKWVVEFDEAQCFASRDYGSQEQPLFLALKAPPAGEVIQLNVLRGGSGGPYAVQLDAKVRLDGAAAIETTMVAHRSNDGTLRIYRINLPTDKFAPARTAKTLTVVGGRELEESFALYQMDAILKLLDTCVADLRRFWNMHDGEDPGPRLVQRARGDLQRLFKSRDYPAIAVREEESGTVTLALLIDEGGKVADCTVIETSGVAALDAQSCAIVKKRGRFQPAIGLDGKPARDSYVQRITWRLE